MLWCYFCCCFRFPHHIFYMPEHLTRLGDFRRTHSIQFTEFSIHSLNWTCYFWLAKIRSTRSQYSWMERWRKKVEESIFRKMVQRIKSINDNSNGTFPSQCAFDSYRWVLVWLFSPTPASQSTRFSQSWCRTLLCFTVNRHQFIYPECTCFNLCISYKFRWRWNAQDFLSIQHWMEMGGRMHTPTTNFCHSLNINYFYFLHFFVAVSLNRSS